jgi:hypothetical protein
MIKYLLGMMLIGLCGVLTLLSIDRERGTFLTLAERPIVQKIVIAESPKIGEYNFKSYEPKNAIPKRTNDGGIQKLHSPTYITENEMKDYLDQFTVELENLYRVWNSTKEEFYRTQMGINDKGITRLREINSSYQNRSELISKKLALAVNQENREDMIRHLVSAEEMYVMEVESILGYRGIDQFIAFRESFNKESRNQQNTDAAVTGF